MTLCRLYHCRPSQLRAERVTDLLDHLAALAAEHLAHPRTGYEP